jgi:23S rRNA (guanosine2251-2'-O)-methyltransferase
MKHDIVYGLHAVSIFLQKKTALVSSLSLLDHNDNKRVTELKRLALKHNIAVHTLTKHALDQLAGQVKHQGVVLQVETSALQGDNALLSLLENLTESPFLLILDGVQDPHNFGACLRSADAAGVHAVIIPKNNAVGITPVVRKVASGAAEAVPIFQVTNLARTMKALKERNIWLVGAAGEASDSIYQTDLTGGLAIIAGAEGSGLRRLTKEHCDFLVNIPMRGVVSSLNVSVATGVLLFEAVRQRTLKPSN